MAYLLTILNLAIVCASVHAQIQCVKIHQKKEKAFTCLSPPSQNSTTPRPTRLPYIVYMQREKLRLKQNGDQRHLQVSGSPL